MNIKRLLALVLATLLALTAFSACDNDTAESDADSFSVTESTDVSSISTSESDDGSAESVESSDESVVSATESEIKDSTVIRIGGLKGPTTMGLVKLMEDAANGNTDCNYAFTVEAAADAITPLLVKGELDVIAIPANVASVLYGKTNGAVQVLNINTLGVLYVVERGSSVKGVSDLKGKTIYATGKGTTPEYSLRYILSANNIDPDKDVTIEWKSEATEVVAHLKTNEGAIAMLPQPFVTVAQTQVADLGIALNLNDEWNKTATESTMVTGVTIVRKAFAKEHPELIKAFLAEYKASTEYIVSNPEEASAWVEAKIGVKAPIAQKAIPYCNINFISGAEMKNKLEGYLSVLFEQNTASVGGAMPNADFYYEG